MTAALATILLTALLTLPAAHSGVVKRSDDVDIEALQATVQQQASAIQTLQAGLAALGNLRNDVDVIKAKSKAVAFTVHFSADNEASGVALGANSILPFDSVVTNVGNSYDPKTGLFTAPVAGVYAFFLSAMSTNSHGYIWLAIDKHGAVLDYLFAYGSADSYDQGSSQVTTRLAAGEQVGVRQHVGDAVRGSWWTVFTGYLLQAE